MMNPVLNAMRLQAQREASTRRQESVGLITSYDPANFSVRVQLQSEQILTGWLPLCSPWIGNGWGMFAAPTVGDMVAVHFFNGDLEAGFVEGRLYNDIDRPLSVPSGEFWLVHATGSFAKLTDAGQILLQDKAGSLVNLNGDGTITVSCPGNASVSVGGNLSASVTGNMTATISGAATANVSGNLAVTAAAASITAPTTITGATTINGNVTVNGNLGASGTITAPNVVGTTDVTFAGKSGKTHVHSGVSTGTFNTGGPV
jgi:uncharacterized protein involved in type VI secretion and phage assembly